VVTLIVLPYVSIGVENVALWLRRVWRGSRPRGAADADPAVCSADPARA
jgi:hypothetical protein